MGLITARKHLSHCRAIFAATDAELDDVVCRRAKVKPFPKPLHTFRKSCIDDWAKVGYHPSVVQAWAGHKNIKTTMMYYSKVDKRDVKRATTETFLPRNDAIRDAIG